MGHRLVAALAIAFVVIVAGCSGTITDGATAPDATTTQQPAGDETANQTTSVRGAASNGTLSVYVLDVGQGTSTLVVGPTNETMLVDSGDWKDDGEVVIAHLQRLGIDRVDYLITSHADADHIGGHAAVIEYLETQGEGVGAVYDPGLASSTQTYREYLDAVETHNVTLYETRANDTIPFENVSVRVLAPPDGYLAGSDRNENSLVLQLGYGNASFLLPGDAETASEEYLLDRYNSSLNSTVLIPAHHGSNSSTGEAFLATVSPRVAVISSGYDSQYGHPHLEVLERLDAHAVQTYWTASHGTVRLQANGTAITVATQQAAPTAPLALRDGDPIQRGSTAPLQVRATIYNNGTETLVLADGGGTTNASETTTTSDSTTTNTPTTTTQTTTGAGPISVARVHADAEGTERDNLDDEYVVFENTGEETVDLSGWTVTDEADHTYTVPSGVTLEPGAKITLHTGSGTDSATDLYWGSGSPIWNNDGDTIIVTDAEGTVVLRESYDG